MLRRMVATMGGRSSLNKKSSSIPLRGLEEFQSLSKPRRGAEKVTTGGEWTAALLRTKSSDDIQKLWFVLLKERNALLSERAESRAKGALMKNPERRTKVKKSMARIKFILHERSLVYKAEMAAKELLKTSV